MPAIFMDSNNWRVYGDVLQGKYDSGLHLRHLKNDINMETTLLP